MTLVSEMDARLAVAAGLSVVCSTCKKWKDSVDRGLPKCLALDGCGSPIVGDTFHEYDGPIVDFLRLCFVCGQPSTKGIRVKGHARLIGACEKHVEYVVKMAPKEPRRLPLIPTTILSPSAGESPAEKLLVSVPTKTLAAALLGMEKGTFKADS